MQGAASEGSLAELVRRLRGSGCVFAEDESRLLLEQAPDSAALDEMVERRVAGVPLEHILGWVDFAGLRIAVEPGVFVPRRRTELVVREAVALIRNGARSVDGSTARPAPVVVDLCCGSGAVGAALAGALGRVELYAVDIDPASVRCARRNISPFRGQVFEGDLFAPLPAGLRGRVDILVANTPYVPSDAVALMPPEARDHEPRIALDGGTDGLDVVRRVAAEASEWLVAGGHLLVETSSEQADAALETFAGNGLTARVARSDDLGATVVIGTLEP